MISVPIRALMEDLAENYRRSLRERLGEQVYEDATGEGAAMSSDDALSLGLAETAAA